LEITYDGIELFQCAIDVDHRVFGIGCQEQGEPVRADLEMCVVVSIRARHMNPRKRDFHIQHGAPFGV
jgi:hypothetical protein